MKQANAQNNTINGVNVDDLVNTINAVKGDPALAEFRFSASNTWIGGGHNRSRVQQFYGCGQVDESRTEPFILDADEPPVLLSNDAGANPVEYVLHSLVACMTTSMVYHAAARGIEITGARSQLEGDLDLRGFLGLGSEVKKGYSAIRVDMYVNTNASPDDLKECISFSPVFEMISTALPVDVVVHTQ